uniref:Ig-like domain-containing protein n=1 Tax=Anas platyrhynchos TaxID=8839 RepID=A0A8B9QSP4_ANAPL
MKPRCVPICQRPASPAPHRFLQGLYFPVIARVIPQHTVIWQGEKMSLTCSKMKSSSTVMYWYKMPLGNGSGLILVVTALKVGKASVEAAFQSHFTSSDIQGDGMTLSTEGAFLNDSGTYYCAESETQWVG